MRLLKLSEATKTPAAYTIYFLPESAADKKRAALGTPDKFWGELRYEKEADASRFASYSESYGRTVGVWIVRDGTPAFAMQEALRKNLPIDSLVKGSAELDFTALAPADASIAINAVGNLYALSQHMPVKYGRKVGSTKPAPKESKSPRDETSIVILKAKGSFAENEETFRTGFEEGKAANLVRELSELPGNELRPAQYLERLRALAKTLNLALTFHDQKALSKLNAGAFLAVVRANPDEPYGIVKLHYRPAGKAGAKRRKIALVGKGICFDTGGYNIKVGEGMLDMHRDMTGSAVALALTKHLVEAGADYEIETYLAIAENLISPSAYRPNDVVVASNGMSIEVVDTDAEGRMVLADTLVMASREKPDLILDFATLTGAVIRALGNSRSGVFSNSARLLEIALKAGTETGERVWSFPIGEDYLTGLESEIADLKQCGPGNYADHIYAATFLSRFIEGEVPWLHVDLASESQKGGLGLSARDVTGFGVRLGKRVIETFLRK